MRREPAMPLHGSRTLALPVAHSRTKFLGCRVSCMSAQNGSHQKLWLILAVQERDSFLPDFIQLGSSRAPFSCGFPDPPIKALDLIRERHTRRLA
jgi:hypothetical protein